MSYATNKQAIIDKLDGTKFSAVFDEVADPKTVTINGQTDTLGGFRVAPLVLGPA